MTERASRRRSRQNLSPMNVRDSERLRRLEESLWRGDTRFDRDYMEAILAPDFVEFGSSGRVWTRAEVVAVEPVEFEAELPLAGFSANFLTDDLVLVTYRSRVDAWSPPAANRSSLWRRVDDRWQLVFHQGTPRPADGDLSSG